MALPVKVWFAPVLLIPLAACIDCSLVGEAGGTGAPTATLLLSANAGQAPLELALDALPKTAVVHDIVYAPLETPLLAAARARGHHVVDGLGMLLYQAQPAFEAWFGVKPEVTPGLRAHVLGKA